VEDCGTLVGDATLESVFDESNHLLFPQITSLADADTTRITLSGELLGETFPTAHQVVMHAGYVINIMILYQFEQPLRTSGNIINTRTEQTTTERKDTR
jgi:hypothetical protein